METTVATYSTAYHYPSLPKKFSELLSFRLQNNAPNGLSKWAPSAVSSILRCVTFFYLLFPPSCCFWFLLEIIYELFPRDGIVEKYFKDATAPSPLLCYPPLDYISSGAVRSCVFVTFHLKRERKKKLLTFNNEIFLAWFVSAHCLFFSKKWDVIPRIMLSIQPERL